MVVATGNAGGMGTFPALNFRPIEKYREAIRDIKARSKAPFGINIIVQKKNKHQHEHLAIALEEKVPLIITSLGSPRDVIRQAQGTGTKVYCDVVGLEHAKKVADLGADGLIAVGAGAGGHAGNTSLLALIPHLKRNLDLPIIAAGSIVDGTGMAAAFALGASAAYMGTRFIASTECKVDEAYKRAILGAEPEAIVNTDRVDGFPGNFILTDSLVRLGLEAPFIEALLTRSKRLKRGLSLLRAAKALLGDQGKKASYKTIFSAGHGVGLIDSVKSAEEIILETMVGYRKAIASLP
jgi:nitronate monooxygenase